MKKFKTWKRWDFKKDPLAYQQPIEGAIDTPTTYMVLLESDYKKIMAVYRAAVKHAEEKDTYDADDYYRLYKAVERAEK